MAVKPLFSIDPFKPVAPVSRPAPGSPAPGGFAASLGRALTPENVAVASELMLGQGLLDILGDGEDSGAGSESALLLRSLLGGQAGLPAGLDSMLAGLPGNADPAVLARALEQLAAAKADPAAAPAAPAAAAEPASPGASPAVPAAIPAPPTLPAALDSGADPAQASEAPNHFRRAGLRAYARTARPAASDPAAAAPAPVGANSFPDLLGRLSARFESGGDPAKIGYDRMGGASYGIYQLSSRAGTLDQFLGFLQARAPQWAARLAAAGPADTGSTAGALPAQWRKIATEDPERFAALQHEFIGRHHFLPAAERIREITGLDLAGNPALAEVLWSTAVQHGPSGSADIVSSAAAAAGPADAPDFAPALVDEIYKRRATRFTSSDEPVREAVQSRLARERDLALSLLRESGMLDSEV